MGIRQEGLSQIAMSKLAKVSNSAVSKYLSSRNISPIDTSSPKKLKYSIEYAREAIKDLSHFVTPIKKKRHAIYNFKGGTGKTSMCFQIATHIALLGYKVLVIDADPQAHLSVSLGFINEDALTLYDAIVSNHRIEDTVQNIYPGLDCIPSNLSLTRLEAELSQMPKREERLKRELERIESNYDFIFIDTNPTISIINRNVINYCDVLDIICETQPYSLNGLKLLMEDLTRFFEQMDIKDKLINIIPNKYEDRKSNAAEAMTVLRTFYSKHLKENFAVRMSEDIVTSAKAGLPLIFFAKKNSIALEDIIELIDYIVQLSS